MHKIMDRSLVFWRCRCGKTWHNEVVRKKSEDDLVAENAKSYSEHLADEDDN